MQLEKKQWETLFVGIMVKWSLEGSIPSLGVYGKGYDLMVGSPYLSDHFPEDIIRDCIDPLKVIDNFL